MYCKWASTVTTRYYILLYSTSIYVCIYSIVYANPTKLSNCLLELSKYLCVCLSTLHYIYNSERELMHHSGRGRGGGEVGNGGGFIISPSVGGLNI